MKKPITTEIRDDGSVIISGYVNAVERDSRLLHDARHGDFYERVAEGAFGAALRRAENEIELKLNHDRVIGKRGENLVLDEDSIGLRASAAVTDPETVEAARAGRLTGWSFRFYVRADEWTVEDGVNHRRLTDIDIDEVSILTKMPAYKATTLDVRAASGEIRAAEVRCTVALDRLSTLIKQIEIIKLKGK